jgi:hypothetical protein
MRDQLKMTNREEVDGWRDGLEYIRGVSMEVSSCCCVKLADETDFPVDLAFRYSGKSEVV